MSHSNTMTFMRSDRNSLASQERERPEQRFSGRSRSRLTKHSHFFFGFFTYMSSHATQRAHMSRVVSFAIGPWPS